MMPIGYVVGIDPGEKGGIAILRNSRRANVVLGYAPLMYNAGMVDPEGLVRFIKSSPSIPNTVVVIERQIAMPKLSNNSIRATFFNYGVIFGVLTQLGIRIFEVAANQWSPAILGKGKSGKAASVEYVKNNYPDVNLVPIRCRKESDGIADAILIARYAILNNIWK